MNFLFGLMPHSFTLSLSDVQIKDSQIVTYDISGEKIAAMPSSGKELKGVGSDFFVVLNSSRIETYNSLCKKIASVPASGKVVVRVGDDCFSVRRGWREKKYDRWCNKLESKVRIKR
jgi:hypothetical protein